jgi:hypothetical protein
MAATGSFQIHVEEHGPHWIGWITRGSEPSPYRAVVLIAANREDAEARARRWAEVSEQARDDEFVTTAV